MAGLDPSGVVTVTSTVPERAGDTAEMEEAELTMKEVAGVPPNSMAIAPLKLIPDIVTEIPPAAGPVVGLIEMTARHLQLWLLRGRD